MRGFGPILAFAVVLGGCATTPPAERLPATGALFAVVPGKDGHVGKIVVYRDGAEPRLIDSAYGAERLGADGVLRTSRLTPAEVKDAFGATLAALPPKPTSFTLYFLEGRDEPTTESRVEMDRMIRDLKARPLPDIVVIGHTDTVGSPEYNDRLSYARAERAREVLVKMGVTPDRIQVAGRGKRELLVPTEDNVPEARNRRVEINVR